MRPGCRLRCVLLVGLVALSSGVAAEPPNIVFFFIDDLGWSDLGYMGSRYYETPHIDRLAADGVVFTDAYANAPNCAPSRACLLSGQYSPRHGIFTVGDPVRGNHPYRKLEPITNKTVLEDRFVTFAEALKASDYVTASMGKWHLGPDPTTQGFDVNIGGKGWGSPSGGGYHSPYDFPNLKQDEKGEYLTDRLTREAIAFIEEQQERRFFLYLTHYAVHTPIQAKAEITAKYEKKAPAGGHHNAEYAAMIESVDDSVGAVLAKLDQLKLAANTAVLFFSDNGGLLRVTSNAPLRGGKGMLYEGGIREPLIIKWPGVTKAGGRCDEPVIGVDLYPTFLEMTGTERPQDYTLDGRSLVPLLRDPTKDLARDAIYWHFPAYLQAYRGANMGPFRTTPAGAIRRGDWKLIEFFEDGKRELYHLSGDLSESRDLAASKPDKAAELHQALVAWRKKVAAPVPTTPNPRYDPQAPWPPQKVPKKKRARKKAAGG